MQHVIEQDKEDRTTLFWAAAQNHGEVVKLLLEDSRGRVLLGKFSVVAHVSKIQVY